LVLKYFRVQNATAEDLVGMVEELLGGAVDVENPDGDPEPWRVQRLLPFANAIIVRDTPQGAEKVLEVLAELDRVAAPPGQEEPVAQTLESFEYSPRHAAAGSLARAIEAFRRNIMLYGAPGQPPSNVANLNVLQDRGVIVIRDTPENVVRIREVLERTDVPRPQVVVTCFVVLGLLGEGEAPAGASLPRELVENLAKLLPFERFQLLSVGVLRTAVAFDDPIQLEADAGPDRRYDLRLRPEAYDAKTGDLTLSSCTFQLRRKRSLPSGEYETSQESGFSTRATVRAGEYTVLGAVGSEPVFVVLRVTPAQG
jgi:hypothetical protein